jgi:hypothetical protein
VERDGVKKNERRVALLYLPFYDCISFLDRVLAGSLNSKSLSTGVVPFVWVTGRHVLSHLSLDSESFGIDLPLCVECGRQFL